jgi:hypothetical protein
MSKEIYHFSDNQHVVRILSTYCAQQEVGFREISLDRMPDRLDCLILIEPRTITHEPYSISTTWKPWLMSHFPHTKLVVAVTGSNTHPNCLDLLNLPENIDAWIDNVLTVSEFRLIDKRIDGGTDIQFIDPWDFGLPKSGKDLNQQMRKFIRGHGMESSFFDQVTNLRTCLMNYRHYHETAPDKEKADAASEGIVQNWRLFRARWNHYDLLFDATPFKKAADLIRKNIGLVSAPMSALVNGPEAALSLSRKGYGAEEIKLFDEIIQTVKKDMLPYIFAEDYW